MKNRRHESTAVLAGTFLLASAFTLSAQEPRLTIAPLVSRVDPSNIYDHSFQYTAPSGAPGTSVERLGVEPATTVGATITFRVVGPWVLSAQAATGSSKYRYFQRDEAGGTFSETEQRGEADMRTGSLTLGRRFDGLANLTYLDVFAGGSVQRMNVRAFPGCGAQPLPPSNGAPPTSFGCDSWHKTYLMPGAIGGAQLYRRVTRHWGVQGGGSYAVSRADTKVFWTDLLPQYDQFEAPKSHRVNASYVFLGIAFDR